MINMLCKSKHLCISWLNLLLPIQVLAESEQMRKEADDTGPLAELEHWRLLTARFNSIVDQIKSKKCKMVINVLNVAKSKVLKVCIQIFLELKLHYFRISVV